MKYTTTKRNKERKKKTKRQKKTPCRTGTHGHDDDRRGWQGADALESEKSVDPHTGTSENKTMKWKRLTTNYTNYYYIFPKTLKTGPT